MPLPKFFEDRDDGPAPRPALTLAKPYEEARPMLASAERLDLRRQQSGPNQKQTQAWQEAAWRYVDNISELKFAFNLIGQIVSRVSIYPAYIHDSSTVPVHCGDINEDFESMATKNPQNPEGLIAASRKATELANDILPPGQQSQFLQSLAVNFGVAGEAYIVHNPRTNRYQVSSIDELKGSAGSYKLQVYKDGRDPIVLAPNNYVARVWRSHPRYWGEPDSTMMGVLDACEQFMLVDQAIRAIVRSRMSAGIVGVPSNMNTVNGQDLESALVDATVMPVEDESSALQVAPLLLTGDAETLKGFQRIDLGRPLDESLIMTQQRALDRILRGIDMPKDVVGGLSDVKFSNAIVIDDNMYRAHIEPLVMLICDSLTSVYFQPALRRAGVSEEIIRKFVLWYNPSKIVTRPDRSQAANEGYDRHILSEDAWRTARGFSDMDAPDPEETRLRLARDKAQIPPELASVLLESIDPEFFRQVRIAGQQQSDIPPGVQDLLTGGDGQAQPPAEPIDSDTTDSTLDEGREGGSIMPGGSMPPRPDVS